MTVKKSCKLLSQPATLALHAALVSYINDTYHIFNIRELNDEIYSFEKILDITDPYYGASPPAEDALQNFIYKLRPPQEYKSEIYEEFLVKKEYLKEGDLDLFRRLSFDDIKSKFSFVNSTSNVEQIEKGIYLHEGNADRETLMSSIMLIEYPKERVLFAHMNERVYIRQDNESGEEYRERIDIANCNIYRKFKGYLLNDELILYEKENDFTCIRDAHKNEENLLIITTKDDLIRRAFKNLKFPIERDKKYKHGKKPSVDHFLTERQKNNIFMQNSRFSSYKERYSFDAIKYIAPITRKNLMLTDQDKRLLKAVENGDAIEMILSIANDADINVQDPETGWTALHWVARLGNPLCLAVIRYERDKLSDMYEVLKREGYKNTEDLELKLLISHKKLDPLILCHKNLFASEKSIRGKNVFETAANPYLQQQEKVFLGILSLESKALKAKGLPIMLCAYPPEERVQILDLASGDNDTNVSCDISYP